MKKKNVFLVIVVAVCMLFSLVAYAGEEQADATEFTNAELTFATSWNGGINLEIMNTFANYVNEHTNGAVTINVFSGGTICSLPEEYDYVMSGTVDIAAPLPSVYVSKNPFLYNVDSLVSDQDSIDFADWLMLENEETAAIVENFNNQQGIKYLGATATGSTVIMGTKPVHTLDDLMGFKVGSGRDLDIWASYGFNTVNVVTDNYESLSRGVVDYLVYSLASAVTDGLYEVAPYCAIFQKYSTACSFIVNLDTWNSLNEATQQVFYDAIKAAQAYSVEAIAEARATMEEKVDEFVVMSLEESEDLTVKMEQAACKNLLSVAETLGCPDDMKAMIKGREEYAGWDLMPEE